MGQVPLNFSFFEFIVPLRMKQCVKLGSSQFLKGVKSYYIYTLDNTKLVYL